MVQGANLLVSPPTAVAWTYLMAVKMGSPVDLTDGRMNKTWCLAQCRGERRGRTTVWHGDMMT